MALPDGILAGTVTFGQAVSLIGGRPTAMTFTIKPTHDLVHVATGVQILDFTETITVEEGMPGSITLPYTDQPGFRNAAGDSFTGWAYTVSGVFRGPSGQSKTFTKNFQLPMGQEVVDFDLIPGGSISLPVTAPVARVTSVLGKTGAVTAEDFADAGLGGGALPDEGVTEAKLAPDSVTQAKIAPAAVGNAELDSDAVTASKIATDAITGVKVVAGAISKTKLSTALAAELDAKLTQTAAAAAYATVEAAAGLSAVVDTKLSKTVADASYAPIGSVGAAADTLGQFEFQPLFVSGHSWVASDVYATAGTRWYQRVASRTRMGTQTNRGVSGRTVGDIANLILSGTQTWTPRTKALVGLICTINDITLFDGSAASRRGYAHSWRSILSLITANAVTPANTAQFAYGPGWSTEAVSGTAASPQAATVNSTSGTRFRTTTVGAFFDVSVTGPSVDIVLVGRAAGAGLATATVAGSTVGTLDLSAATAQDTPAVLKLRNLGAGTRTIRVTLTSGASLTVDSIRIPSTTPPPILVLGEPTVIPTGADHSTYLADLEQFKTDLAAIVAEYSTAVYLNLNSTPGWSTATMLSDDGKHPNDAGAAFIATAAIAKLATLPYVPGLNATGASYAPAYVAPAAPTIPQNGQDGTGASGGSATTPGAPTGLVLTPGNNQLTASWTAPASNGGSDITDYVVQHSSDESTWTTFADGTSTSAGAVITGLTNGSLRYVRVAAVNSVGTGPYSATASAAPGVPDTTAPTVPTTPVATGGNGSATVTVGGSTDAVGVAGYRVFSSADGYATPVATGTASPITVTGLTNGAAVTFQTAAYDAAGNQSAKSATSNSVTPAAPAPTLITDTFTGADGPLAGRTTEQGGRQWAHNGATVFGISANAVKALSGTGNSYDVVDANTADGTIEATLTAVSGTPSTMIAGLCLSYVDENNNVTAQLRTSTSTARWCIVKRVAGSNSIQTPTVNATPLAAQVVRVEKVGTTYTLRVNGSLLWTGSITEFAAATKHGFYSHGGDLTTTWDGFSFTPAAA